MVKLDRIYTRGGDGGATSLGDGTRLPKDDIRIQAIGSVDEANATLGIARLAASQPVSKIITRVQNDLFDIGADLCIPLASDSRPNALRVSEDQVKWLENCIDEHNEALKPLDSFVLPGGSVGSSHLHLARTVVRRSERDVAALAARELVTSHVRSYLNRLSDLLFVLARVENESGRLDVKWQPGGGQHGTTPDES